MIRLLLFPAEFWDGLLPATASPLVAHAPAHLTTLSHPALDFPGTTGDGVLLTPLRQPRFLRPEAVHPPASV